MINNKVIIPRWKKMSLHGYCVELDWRHTGHL